MSVFITALKISYENALKKIKDLEEEMEVHKDAVQDLLYDKRDLEKENRKLKEQIEILESQNFALRDRLKFGYKGVTKEEIEAVEEKIKNAKCNYEKLEKENSNLNRKLDRISSILGEK